MAKHKVLIIGGGFGGVKAALELSDNDSIDITLVSDGPDLRYYPTLYHTATGGKKANSSIPLSAIFENKKVKIIDDKAVKLDRKSRAITTANGESLEYDSLIIGLGVVTNYFGIPGLDKYSYSIKTQDEVARFKKHLHQQMDDDRRPDLHYVIVGAGPTGIELAGALPGYLKHIMKNHGVKDRKVHIDIIEALPRLLPRMPKYTSKVVGKRLKNLGIKLYLGKAVQGQSIDELTVSGKPIRSHTVVWTAGVTNHPFFKENEFVLTKRGKVAVDVYLQAEDNIFVIGDNANTPFSGLAQTAIYDGEFVAINIKRKARGKDYRSYIAKQPVTVIPAGPHWSAVLWGKISLHGRPGWLLREASYLIGFRDIQPWPKAVRQFMSEFEAEDGCPVCAGAAIN
jgi:NADH:ubiquinone reductase (H+-translocating)